MKRSWIYAFIALIPGYFVSAQGPPPQLVELAEIEELEFHDQLTLVGRTEAQAESDIVAEVAGRVESIDALEGRRVRRGTVLVTIDCRRVALALEAKRAEAAQVRADAELAQKELERARDLVKTEVFPERNLDSAEADAARTTARHRQLEAESRRLELDLENCAIRAPYNGYTIRRLVEVGEWVDPGTAVYQMVDLSTVKVTVELPERYFGQVELGGSAEIAVSGDDAARIVGEIYGIAPRASQATHTFPVILAVDNSGGRLGSGMLVKATLTLEDTFRSLAVSKDALVRETDGVVVYTVVDDKAMPVSVEVRASLGTKVAIAGDGLVAGDTVVVRGNERISPGSPVRVHGSDDAQNGSEDPP